MTFLRLLPSILSLLFLAAHILRAGLPVAALILVALPVLFVVKKVWVIRLIQIVLVLGALEWVRTLMALIWERQEAEMPWVRLAAILGGVVVLTLASVLMLSRVRALRRRYGFEKDAGLDSKS